MSDFSYFSLFTAGLACLVPFTAAYTKPVGDEPKGNPIYQPGLNTVVPVGETFTITWDPTTDGTVTLVLLKGPSTNAVPLYPIVEKTENDGSYTWTPKDNLEPTTDATGYGIQLIVDSTGQYQYTTQFGISNPDYKEETTTTSSVSKASKATVTSEAAKYPTAAVYTTEIKTYTTTYCPEKTTLTYGNTTYTTKGHVSIPIYVTKTWTSSSPKGTGASSYITPTHNVTMVAPTGYLPTTVKTTTAKSTSPIASATFEAPTSTGAASRQALSAVGLVAAAGAAVFAL